MYRTMIFSLLGAAIICAVAMAQGDHPSPRLAVNSVRLILIPGSREGPFGPEQILTARLANNGQTTLRFPDPTRLCVESLNGYVMVHARALSPSKNQERGFGCFIYRVARTDILAEAKQWKTLAPGKVYDLTFPLAMLSLNADARYELKANYYPPTHFSTEELSLLATNGITVLQEQLESTPIIVEPQEQ